jgi:hypothetical protein
MQQGLLVGRQFGVGILPRKWRRKAARAAPGALVS